MRVISGCLGGLLVLATACDMEDPPPPPPPANANQPVAAAPAAPPGAQPIAPANAQGNAAPAAPGGIIALEPGFAPDPHAVQVSIGGNISASNFHQGCTGWISGAPAAILNNTNAFGSLFIAATSSVDTTLVVQLPNGQYLCNDDTNGYNPMVQGSIGPGQTKVWVGTFSQGQSGMATLSFSEISGSTGGSAVGPSNTGQLDVTGSDSSFGTEVFAANFTPDPRVLEGSSGGSVDAGEVNMACRGHIARIPDHILQLGASMNLRLAVNASQDTTLVVRTADGQFHCDDDTQGTNPAVTLANAQGEVRVWVGTYSGTNNIPYRLGVSTANVGLMPDGF